MNKIRLNFYAEKFKAVSGLNVATLIATFLLAGSFAMQSWAQLTITDQPLPSTLPQTTAEVFGTIDGNPLFYTPLVVGPQGPNAVPPSAVMADSVGNVMWYYHAFDTSGNISATRIRDFKVFWDGTMSIGIWDQFFVDHTYLILDTNFNVTDSIECQPYELDAHDIIKTLDGHYHLTCFIDSTMDASILTNTQGQSGAPDAFVVGLLIRELDENLSIVREWNSLEHYPLTDMYEEYFNTDSDFVDFTHTNAIAVDLDSNWVVSHRHLNEISCIDPQTGEFVWRLNGKQSSFTFINEGFNFSGQHDCRVLPNGNVTIFDNATLNADPNAYARGVEYKLDTVAGTATNVFEYAEPSGLPAGFIGSNQRLDNGNSLIGWGGILPTTAGLTASEVDANGNLMMTFDIAAALAYRIKRHPFPYTIVRPALNYNPFTYTLSTDPATVYNWSTGESTQSIQIEEAGSYRVFTPYGVGFMGSERFDIPDVFTSLFTTNVTDESATLNWDAVSGAVSYNVRYKLSSDESYITAATTGTSVNVADLDPGQTYTWQVQAVYGVTNSLYSVADEFTTVSFGPPEPTFSSNITFTSATLNWTLNAEAIQYFLRGKNLNSGTSSYTYLVIPANQSSITISNLPEGTSYNWQIASIFESGISDFSDMDTFSLQNCESPVNLMTTNVSSNSAILNWEVSPNAQSYLLGGRPVGSSAFVTVPIADPATTSFTAGGLVPGVTYEWSIVSICAAGRVSVIPPLSVFTTLNGPAAKGVESTFGTFTESIALYPNPAKDQVTINTGGNFQEAGYELFIHDLNGRTVYAASNNVAPLLTIDLSDIPNGIYLVNMQSASTNYTKKLIIAR